MLRQRKQGEIQQVLKYTQTHMHVYAGVVVNKERSRIIKVSPCRFICLCSIFGELYLNWFWKIIFIHYWLILDHWVLGCGSHYTSIHWACNSAETDVHTLAISIEQEVVLNFKTQSLLAPPRSEAESPTSLDSSLSKVTAFIRRRNRTPISLSFLEQRWIVCSKFNKRNMLGHKWNRFIYLADHCL